MTGWISIDERWLDMGVPVLAFTADGMAVAMWELVGGRRWWSPCSMGGEYGYEVFLSSLDSRRPNEAVSHWMPLPGAP